MEPNGDITARGAALRVALIGVAALATGVGAFFVRERFRSGGTEASTEGAVADTGGVVAWCAPGLEAIAGGGCFALPASGLPSPAPLIVYLHGMYDRSTTGEELERQARVARLATARGFAVLALRGKQGECAGEQLAQWWCWPSNERNDRDGPAFVAGWANALGVATRRNPGGARYLIGFSNGGYFAVLIATRALHPFDAIAIAHAGPVEPVRSVGPKPPLLLLTADEDPSIESMLRLDAELSHDGWLHAIVTRDGGHALTESDVTTAMDFFTRIRREKLPLVPPLSTRAPHPRLPREADAGVAGEPAASASAEEAPSGAPSPTPAAPTATEPDGEEPAK